MTPPTKIEEIHRQRLKDKLGEEAVSHHDYLYNYDTAYKVTSASGEDTHKIFLNASWAKIETKALFCRELIEIDQRIRLHGLEYYLSQTGIPRRIGFYHECALIQQWLNTNNSVFVYENLMKIDDAMDKMLKAFASIKPHSTRIDLSQHTGHPLSLAVYHHKMHVAKALLLENACISEAMIQFAVEGNKIDLLKLLINNPEGKIDCLVSVLKFNFTKPQFLFTAEMLTLMMTYLKNPKMYVNYTHENLMGLNQEQLRIIIPVLTIDASQEFLYYAARQGNTTVVALCLDHPYFNIKFSTDALRRIRHFDKPELAVIDLLLNKQIELFLKGCKEKAFFKYERDASLPYLLPIACVTQEQVASYILNRAQVLPRLPQSIVQIKEDIAEIKGNTHLNIFLQGLVLGRLRNKLIADLEGEITKIQATIQQSNNEGTSSRVNYQAPNATRQPPAQDKIENGDIELPELNKLLINTNI